MNDANRFFCNEQLAQNRPDQDGRLGHKFFLTRKVWDVGYSAIFVIVATWSTPSFLVHPHFV